MLSTSFPDLFPSSIDSVTSINKSDNHIKGTPEHTMRMDLMICLGKKSNPTQEVPYATRKKRYFLLMGYFFLLTGAF